MSDDETQEQTPPSASLLETVGLEVTGERRKEQDRRQTGRQGKYDRRKNRCVHCLHFQEEETAGKGFCRFHQVAMVSYAFACPNFEALPVDSRAEGRPDPRPDV